MAKYLSTNSLINSIKRRATLPETQNTFTEDDFLAFANEEMDIGIIPHILSFHEDYLVYVEDLPIKENQSNYKIPSRSIGNKLRDVAYRDNVLTYISITDITNGTVTTSSASGLTNGAIVVIENNGNANLNKEWQISNVSTNTFTIPTNESSSGALGSLYLKNQDVLDNSALYEMTRISIEDAPYYQYGQLGNNTSLKVFYIKNNEIILLPTPQASSGSLSVAYYLRPNELVAENRVGILSADPNFTTGEVTLTSMPDTLADLGSMDIIQHSAPFKNIAMDITPISVNLSTNTLTFNAADLPTDLRAGDMIALAGESIIPQIPQELHSMLAQRVAARCLEALSDVQGLTAANAKLAEMEAKTGSLIDSRVEGAPLKVIARHNHLRRGNRKYLRR